MSKLLSKVRLSSKVRSLVLLLFILVVILGAGFMMGSCVYYRTELEAEYVKQADQAYSEERYQDALEYYEKAKFISLNNSSRFKVAEIQLRLQNYDESRKHIKRLLFRDRNNIYVKELDAYWNFSTGDVETAISKYEDILELEPMNSRVLINLGIMYFKNKDFSKSLEYFNLSLEEATLPVEALPYYLEIVSVLPQAEGKDIEIVEDRKRTYMIAMVDQYLDGYKAGEVSVDELSEVIKIISFQYSEYAYPLYIALAEEEATPETQQGVAAANFRLAEIIFTEKYVPLDIDSRVYAFEKLTRALEFGLADSSDYVIKMRQLIPLMSTSIQKRLLVNLYHDYAVIGSSEYYQLLLEVEQEEKGAGERSQADSSETELGINAKN